ncbi:MAG: hypothetical protein H6739_19305 [Alphaproteobacteria bacterium]|nr:hypothetical protein [Alphaproteobacteria bacterium]
MLALLLLPGCLTCEPLVEGPWTLGAAFPFGDAVRVETLGVDVAMETEADRYCAFTFSDWTSADGALPDSLPTGGVVNLDEAFLKGDDLYWVSCEGEVVDDGRAVDGWCFSGSPFDFAHE